MSKQPAKQARAAANKNLLWIALVAVGLAAALYVALPDQEAAPEATATLQSAPVESAAARRSPPGETPEPPQAGDLAAQQAQQRLAIPRGAQQEQGPTGIHAFPPLGTRLPLVGIIVPDDFELPPGYVRHYQSTDDGRRLAPILMFDPVNPPLDEFGQAVDIPPDRIVPADLAPAGMPIILLEVPEPRNPDAATLRGLLRPG